MLFMYNDNVRYRGVAQLVEQRSPKPPVACSSRVSPARTACVMRAVFLYLFYRKSRIKSILSRKNAPRSINRRGEYARKNFSARTKLYPSWLPQAFYNAL